MVVLKYLTDSGDAKEQAKCVLNGYPHHHECLGRIPAQIARCFSAN